MKPEQEKFVRSFRKDFTVQERIDFRKKLEEVLKNLPDTLNNVLVGFGYDDDLGERLVRESIDNVNKKQIPPWLLV